MYHSLLILKTDSFLAAIPRTLCIFQIKYDFAVNNVREQLVSLFEYF